jgi:glycolate oxidase iron-sulfur subunit
VSNHLRELDYAVLQQCMHCGMCLPTCPTYVETKVEKNSPRGRISLMRAIADGRLETTKAFADEMYFCLGCLACETACPAGVDYTQLFEASRAEAEASGVLQSPQRDVIRGVLLRGLFTRPRLLRFVGRLLWIWQASGGQALFRKLGLPKLLPYRFRELERMTPTAQAEFSHQKIRPIERPAATPRYRVGLLTGCVQDIVFSDINRDTADVLLANGCEVVTPSVQACCGSLHAHNGEEETARVLARRMLDSFDLDKLDAIITNAAGCGSHLKHYDHLLKDDAAYFPKAQIWVRKLRDVHEWLAEIGIRPPTSKQPKQTVTYHEACHLCHAQKITKQPREVLRAVPGLELKELAESTWCCGSAGIYNITQPEMASKLQERKLGHIAEAGADVVTTANPGCLLQIQSGARKFDVDARVCHPVTLLAEAYRAEAGNA